MKFYGLLAALVLCSLCRADTTEEIVKVQSHTPLVLNCSYTEGIQWYKNGEQITAVEDSIEISGNQLKIVKPTPKDIASYACKVTGDVSKVHSFKVEADIKLKRFPQSVNVVEGDKFRIECEVAVGEPKPSFKWTKTKEDSNDTESVTAGTNDDRIHLESANNFTDNVLVIGKVEMEDRARYTCIADNGKSSDDTTVLLRVKDKYAALWPFLGIVAEVLILCIIIFIYERRRSKAEFEESDNEQNETKNAADNAKGGELRHRK